MRNQNIAQLNLASVLASLALSWSGILWDKQHVKKCCVTGYLEKWCKINLPKLYLYDSPSSECKLNQSYSFQNVLLLASTKISFHVWPLTHCRNTWHQNRWVCCTMHPRQLLPCLGSGFVPCSYEQSRCNLEAESRLLHPLGQELPLLPGWLSSQFDTARNNCNTETLLFQKHETPIPKHLLRYSSFASATSHRHYFLYLWTICI